MRNQKRYEVVGLLPSNGGSTRLAEVHNLWQAQVVIDEFLYTGRYAGIQVFRLHDGKLVDMNDWRWSVMAKQSLRACRRKLSAARRSLRRAGIL